MNAPVRIGDNRPAIVTADQLAKDFAHVGKAVSALEERANSAPPVIEDEDDLGVIRAFVVEVREERKRIGEIAETETKPYYNAHRTAHAFFSALVTRLTLLQGLLESRGKRYLDKKAEEERKVREAEARKSLEEADRKREAAIAAAIAAAKSDAPEAKAAITAAATAQVQADAAVTAASAKSADLARAHVGGGTASLTDGFTFEITNWDKLDLEVLRPYIRRDELEKALRALLRAREAEIKSGKLTVAGVAFKPTTKAKFT